MSNTVFNLDNPETLFLNKSQGVSIQRFDCPKYDSLLKIMTEMLDSLWHPNEISMNTDRVNMLTLSKAEEHIVMSNIKRQILLDSIMGRAPMAMFGPAIGDPTLESLVTTWTFFEALHSFSYTHIIQQSFVNPTEVLDGVMDIQEIAKCKDSIAEHYDNCIDKVSAYYNGEISRYEAVKAIWLAIHTANALESIRFQVSFACSFAFGHNGKLPGLARVIKLINRDENLHVAVTNNLIRILPIDDPDFLEVSKDPEVLKLIEDIWRVAIMEEYEWVDPLFEYGEIPGFNAKILKKYLQYIATIRLKKNGIIPLEELCGLESVYSNPIPWINSWNGIEKEQSAPQEVEKTDYERGILDMSSTNSYDNLSVTGYGNK